MITQAEVAAGGSAGGAGGAGSGAGSAGVTNAGVGSGAGGLGGLSSAQFTPGVLTSEGLGDFMASPSISSPFVPTFPFQTPGLGNLEIPTFEELSDRNMLSVLQGNSNNNTTTTPAGGIPGVGLLKTKQENPLDELLVQAQRQQQQQQQQQSSQKKI